MLKYIKERICSYGLNTRRTESGVRVNTLEYLNGLFLSNICRIFTGRTAPFPRLQFITICRSSKFFFILFGAHHPAFSLISWVATVKPSLYSDHSCRCHLNVLFYFILLLKEIFMGLDSIHSLVYKRIF